MCLEKGLVQICGSGPSLLVGRLMGLEPVAGDGIQAGYKNIDPHKLDSLGKLWAYMLSQYCGSEIDGSLLQCVYPAP